MKRKSRLGLLCLALGAFWLGCGSGSPIKPPTSRLNLVASRVLSINEPSGLAINDSATSLWAVTNQHVYHLDMSGQVIKRLNYDGVDLEGITYDRSDRTLWVAEEASREVVHLDLNGDVLSRTATGLTGVLNHGIEGICLDSSGRMFVLNEQDPGLLVELRADHTVATQQTLTFADDYSDLAASSELDHFWILSDQSRSISLLARPGGVVRQYTLPFPKPEGLAVDEAANRFYVVSDSTHTLYIYAPQ